MNTKEIKELVSSNADLRSEMNSYVDSYVDWVVKNVPAGLEDSFGVGIASDNRHGTYWGFETDNEYNGTYYAQTGRSWYAGNDYNCKVMGSDAGQVRRFAKKIPVYLQKGLERVEDENSEIAEVLKSKFDFS